VYYILLYVFSDGIADSLAQYIACFYILVSDEMYSSTFNQPICLTDNPYCIRIFVSRFTHTPKINRSGHENKLEYKSHEVFPA